MDQTGGWHLNGLHEWLRATLMFAKFSPDATKVGYVHDRNVYVQDLADQTIVKPTSTDAPTKINGTFDWVYEEEFSLRDGFRFSPNGKRIAFWEIDASGIEQFPLVDNTSTLYPEIQYIPYPKVGTTNPAARIGVIDLGSLEKTWARIPGDTRENYLPRMEWVDSSQLAIQHLNRRQNHWKLYLVNTSSDAANVLLEEEDAAWIDVHDETIWLKDKSRFLWLSENSGWRQIYLVSRDGHSVVPVTAGKFDVIEVLGVDEDEKLI